MVDPICGMAVAEPPPIFTVWKDQIYGFCSSSCLSRFQTNPEKYLSRGMDSGPYRNVSKIKSFLPLIIVFVIILGASAGAEIYFQSWNHLRFMENFMAAFFIVFSAMKLFNWKGFAEAYQTYDLLAKRSRTYSYLYPFIELFLGLSYLFRWNLNVINLITVIVMAMSAAGVGRALYRNQKLQCACLGVIFQIPMTQVTLLEDVLMGLMALAMLIM